MATDVLSFIDRLTAPIAPRWTARRMRARVAMDLLQAHYEAATHGRRTLGWRRPSSDANAAQRGDLATLRNEARDLIRNNAFAEAALSTIVDHTVGWGITASTSSKRAEELWKAWAESTACDAEGRQDFAGLEKTVMRTIAESGECLVRRRWRKPDDVDVNGETLPIPMQLQILEPDYLDSLKEQAVLPNLGEIIQGVEFDAIGRRVAYWLFPEHPGSLRPSAQVSNRIPASEILHIFRPGRPGAVRGATWLAPVMLRLKDLDGYLDAALMKQKIAACLAVITSDVTGDAAPLGVAVARGSGEQEIDRLEPGLIHNAPPGRSVTVVDPPAISEHAAYTKTVLQEIATGLGLAYEDVTGNYDGLPYSAARMSRLRHWARVHGWRWGLLIPQFCQPAWQWAMIAAQITTDLTAMPSVAWTAPPPPMLDPNQEAIAYTRLLRIGGITWPEMIRELGYEPEAQLAEIAKWKGLIDARKLIFDSDPSKTTMNGQLQGSAAVTEAPTAPDPTATASAFATNGAH